MDFIRLGNTSASLEVTNTITSQATKDIHENINKTNNANYFRVYLFSQFDLTRILNRY